MENSLKKKIIDFVIDLITIALVVGVLRTFIIAPFRVSGPSMCDTLNKINGECVSESTSLGEFMIIDKVSYLFSEPKRGDIVVFKPEGANIYYIKRIIGIGGDVVDIEEDGFVYLTPKGGDKAQLEEKYLNNESYGTTIPWDENARTFAVPEGNFFVLGDNRSHSSDSRNCFHFCSFTKPNHFITKKQISGRAWLTLFPFSNIKAIGTYDYGIN